MKKNLFVVMAVSGTRQPYFICLRFSSTEALLLKPRQLLKGPPQQSQSRRLRSLYLT